MTQAEHLTDEQLEVVLRGEPIVGPVAGHLLECPECARAVVDQRALDGLLSGPSEVLEEHPHDAELSALRDEALAPNRAAEVQAHLRRCGRCLVGFLRRRAELDLGAPTVPSGPLVAQAMASFPVPASTSTAATAEEPDRDAVRTVARSNLRAAVAAGFTALVLGYPAYRGLTSRPATDADPGGLVTVGYLTATPAAGLRSTPDDPWGDPGRVPVIPDGPVLLILGVPLGATFLDEADVDEGYEIRLVDVDGAISWTLKVTAGQLRRAIETSADRAVNVRVPGEFVRPGDFELQIVPEATPDEALLVAPVRIVDE